MNLQDENRDGYLIPASMKKVWNVQLEMVKLLLDICNRNKLNIWADSGTLLGAVRNKGYIPWDDDIDMIMLRSDYDRLLEIADKEFPAPYFLQSAKNEAGFFRGHAQLRKSDTAAILKRDIWQNFNQGIFVDIFVYDYLPSSAQERSEIGRNVTKMQRVMNARMYGSLLSKNPLLHLLSKSIIKRQGGRYQYFKNIESLIKNRSDKSDSLLGAIMFKSNCKIVKKEWYENTIYLPFEDIMMPVPKEYDKILTTLYGDYMTPSNAPTAHGSVIFDTDHPYAEVLDKMRSAASIFTKLKHIFSIK